MSEATAPSPIGNENEDPSTAAASLGWKSYVPSGDRRIVLSAIDIQLNASKNAWKEKHNAAADGGECNSAKEEFFMKLVDTTGTLLKSQIDVMTVPADEAEVERKLDSFRSQLFAARPSSSTGNGIDSSSDDESLSSVDDQEEEIEFDENQILDQDAYDQAKQLRRRAREISARVISIREETSGRALEMTRRNISELMKVHGYSENAAEDDGKSHNDHGSEQAQEDINEGTVALNPMHIALQTLTTSIQNVDSGLAEKLESLKETIGTIDSSLEKHQRISQGDESALSQTEKVLFAPTATPKEAIVESEEESDESPMNPDKKLASLLAGIL